jgi:hypothetical protein
MLGDVGRLSGHVSLVRGVVRDGRKIVSFLALLGIASECCSLSLELEGWRTSYPRTHSANIHPFGPSLKSQADFKFDINITQARTTNAKTTPTPKHMIDKPTLFFFDCKS